MELRQYSRENKGRIEKRDDADEIERYKTQICTDVGKEKRYYIAHRWPMKVSSSSPSIDHQKERAKKGRPHLQFLPHIYLCIRLEIYECGVRSSIIAYDQLDFGQFFPSWSLIDICVLWQWVELIADAIQLFLPTWLNYDFVVNSMHFPAAISSPFKTCLELELPSSISSIDLKRNQTVELNSFLPENERWNLKKKWKRWPKTVFSEQCYWLSLSSSAHIQCRLCRLLCVMWEYFPSTGASSEQSRLTIYRACYESSKKIEQVPSLPLYRQESRDSA